MKIILSYILFILLLIIPNLSIAQELNIESSSINLTKTMSSKEVISLIKSNDIDTSLITLLDFQKWPHQKDTYIIVAYFAANKERKENHDETNIINCDEIGKTESIDIYMLELDDNLKFIATNSNSASIFTDDFNNIEYNGLDFDKYRVSDHKIAFGIRTITNALYSGGWMAYYLLALFVKDNNELINIFSSYMGEDGELAGKWIVDENGEFAGRERIEQSIESKLVFLPNKTSGFYDFEIQISATSRIRTPTNTDNKNGSVSEEQTETTRKIKYQWNTEQKMYSPIIY